MLRCVVRCGALRCSAVEHVRRHRPPTLPPTHTAHPSTPTHLCCIIGVLATVDLLRHQQAVNQLVLPQVIAVQLPPPLPAERGRRLQQALCAREGCGWGWERVGREKGRDKQCGLEASAAALPPSSIHAISIPAGGYSVNVLDCVQAVAQTILGVGTLAHSGSGGRTCTSSVVFLCPASDLNGAPTELRGPTTVGPVGGWAGRGSGGPAAPFSTSTSSAVDSETSIVAAVAVVAKGVQRKLQQGVQVVPPSPPSTSPPTVGPPPFPRLMAVPAEPPNPTPQRLSSPSVYLDSGWFTEPSHQAGGLSARRSASCSWHCHHRRR